MGVKACIPASYIRHSRYWSVYMYLKIHHHNITYLKKCPPASIYIWLAVHACLWVSKSSMQYNYYGLFIWTGNLRLIWCNQANMSIKTSMQYNYYGRFIWTGNLRLIWCKKYSDPENTRKSTPPYNPTLSLNRINVDTHPGQQWHTGLGYITVSQAICPPGVHCCIKACT